MSSINNPSWVLFGFSWAHSTTEHVCMKVCCSLGRSLDVPAAREIERLQAMRFVRQVREGERERERERERRVWKKKE